MSDWRHSLACPAQDGRECTCKCTCTYYGRGLSETRVVAPACPVHVNNGQPLSIMLDGEETLLCPDEAGNTLITFGDGTFAVHVESGKEWRYVEGTS